MNVSEKVHVLLAVLSCGLFLCLSSAAESQTGRSATHGTLILTAPVQAVASINGQGTFLIVPGGALRWNSIPPGQYNILIESGRQQWHQQVQINAGESKSFAAVLASSGPPLSTSFTPPPPPAVQKTVSRPQPPPPPRLSHTSTTTQQPKEAVNTAGDHRPGSPPPRQPERESPAARRKREADETRGRREAKRREEEERKQQQRSQRVRRPRVH